MLVLHPTYTFPNGVNIYLFSAILYPSKKNLIIKDEANKLVNRNAQLIFTSPIVLFFAHLQVKYLIVPWHSKLKIFPYKQGL